MGVQPYGNLCINGGKCVSTPIYILEKNESNPKPLAFAFKPSQNKHDIFELYRYSIEEGNFHEGRDLAPFTLFDLNGKNQTNKVYYGMPRKLEQNVIDENKLNLCDSYDAVYSNNEKVKWYFYEQNGNRKLGNRNTIMLVSLNDTYKEGSKYQYHKLLLKKHVPCKFINLLEHYSR